jgi:hypothetical protein
LRFTEVVLDEDNRVSLLDKFVQHVEQLGHVMEMATGAITISGKKARARIQILV